MISEVIPRLCVVIEAVTQLGAEVSICPRTQCPLPSHLLPFSLTKLCITNQREEIQKPSCFLLFPVLKHRGCAEAPTIPPLWKGVGAKEGEEENTAADPSGSKASSGLVGSKGSIEQRTRLGRWTS